MREFIRVGFFLMLPPTPWFSHSGMYQLGTTADYHYTNQSSLKELPGVDDAEDYARVRVHVALCVLPKCSFLSLIVMSSNTSLPLQH